MFVSLKTLLPIALNRKGISKEAGAAHVCEVFRKVAAEIIHPEALNHMYPRFFQRGVLTVGVDHAAWAQLIYQKRNELLEELRSRVREVQVNHIRTQVSPPKESAFDPSLQVEDTEQT